MQRKFPIDPYMPLADLLTKWPETIPVFMRHRMLCVGCYISPFHSVSDACAEYGLDEEKFFDELKAVIRS